jgi:hypothetical protein
MAWVTISADRTDAEKPLSEVLMDDVRTDLDALFDGSAFSGSIGQGALKSTTEEESQALGSGNDIVETFSNVGAYGFYPRIKVSGVNKGECFIRGDDGNDWGTSYTTQIYMKNTDVAGTVTYYAIIRYIQASRNEPVVWLVQESDGNISGIHFSPECCGYDTPWPNHPRKDSIKIFAIELKRSPELCKHLFKNFGKAGESWCWQIGLAIHEGLIHFKSQTDPLLPNMTDKQRRWMIDNGLDHDYDVSKTTSAPALYHPDVKVLDFSFDVDKLKDMEV